MDSARPREKTPLLTNGPLLDEFGQSAQRDWPEKTRDYKKLVVDSF